MRHPHRQPTAVERHDNLLIRLVETTTFAHQEDELGVVVKLDGAAVEEFQKRSRPAVGAEARARPGLGRLAQLLPGSVERAF